MKSRLMSKWMLARKYLENSVRGSRLSVGGHLLRFQEKTWACIYLNYAQIKTFKMLRLRRAHLNLAGENVNLADRAPHFDMAAGLQYIYCRDTDSLTAVSYSTYMM
jgi:hypothetical protein